MIDFTTLKELSIPEGIVVKIEKNGQTMWTPVVENAVVSLEVEKITSNTYANDTSYTGEEFILLDIYPKTNGTVDVTYGGLTKTITDTSGEAEPAAQKVYFGTFNGVTDGVATPTSGELTISGDYRGFAVGSFNNSKATTIRCSCITAVNDWGDITLICDYAFYNCKSLTDITIPNGVTSIGQHAFYYCSLTSITIPDGVTSIAGSTFRGCSSLTSVTIPDSVTSIGNYAFYGCSSLTSVTIPDSVTSIAQYAFYDCSELTSITIPDSVTSVGWSAFEGCSSLTSITIGDSVTSIGDYAFCNCSSLTSITIPNSVISIGKYAFYGCSSLTSITIPSSVTTVQKQAFSGCTNLASLTFEETEGWHYYQDNGTKIFINVTNPQTNASNFTSGTNNAATYDISRS